MSETAKTTAPAAASSFSVPRETTEAVAGCVVRVRACDRCEGRGKRLDAVHAGELIRAERRALNIRTAAFAAQLAIKTAYLIDLEMGRRAWTWELFLRAVGALTTIRAEREVAQ